MENLRVREEMPSTANVGFVNLVSGDRSKTALKRHAKVIDVIYNWARASGYDGAIWTALGTNFAEKVHEAFSVEAVIRYLGAQDKICFARSLHYIWNVPKEIQTPVRDAVILRWPEHT
jgi:hypothetical protein